MRAFEIHTFRDGQWKVDSVFDARELAIHEARKVDESGRYAGVRVIEENYDEVSDKTTTRTIFRGKKETELSKARQSIAKGAGAGSAAPRGRGEREFARKSRPRPKKKKSGGVLVPVLILLLLVITGVAVMFGLHYVGGLKI